MEIDARRRRDAPAAHGEIASLATLDGADATSTCKGADLADLYKLFGVVLPETPQLRGARASHQARRRLAREADSRPPGPFRRRGRPRVRQAARRAAPRRGSCESKLLDFNDLAPLVGLQDKPRRARSGDRRRCNRRSRRGTRTARCCRRRARPRRLKAMNCGRAFRRREGHERAAPAARPHRRARAAEGRRAEPRPHEAGRGGRHARQARCASTATQSRRGGSEAAMRAGWSWTSSFLTRKIMKSELRPDLRRHRPEGPRATARRRCSRASNGNVALLMGQGADQQPAARIRRAWTAARSSSSSWAATRTCACAAAPRRST